jgi:hypothetical protein
LDSPGEEAGMSFGGGGQAWDSSRLRVYLGLSGLLSQVETEDGWMALAVTHPGTSSSSKNSGVGSWRRISYGPSWRSMKGASVRSL